MNHSHRRLSPLHESKQILLAKQILKWYATYLSELATGLLFELKLFMSLTTIGNFLKVTYSLLLLLHHFSKGYILKKHFEFFLTICRGHAGFIESHKQLLTRMSN